MPVAPKTTMHSAGDEGTGASGDSRRGRSRYRTEGGLPCVDVKMSSIEHFFDKRDPAPFRERDLDPDLSEYLRDSAEDLLHEDRIRLVFWLEKAGGPGEIENAFRVHFEYEIQRLRRSRRRARRTGVISLGIALVLVGVFLFLSQLVGSIVPGSLGTALKEGLVIAGWVVMWRPVEVLIYDWIPSRHERRIMSKLLAAELDVRTPEAHTVPDGDLAARQP